MRRHHPDSFKCLMCDIQFHFSARYIDHMINVHSMTVNVASNKSEYEVDIPFDRLRFKPNINNQQNVSKAVSKLIPDHGNLKIDRYFFLFKFFLNTFI